MRIKKLFIVAVASLALCSCEKKNTKALTDKEVGSVIGTSKMKKKSLGTVDLTYNYDNVKELVENNQYVFVAKVDKYVETKYNKENPETVYNLDILENLKGDLSVSENIDVVKTGGLLKNSDAFVLWDDDVLPAVGETYIFVCNDDNGTVKCASPKSNALAGNDYKNSKIYSEYVEVCK